MAGTDSQQVVNKAWNFAHVLLQDGQMARTSWRQWQDIVEHVTGCYSLVPDSLIDDSVAVQRNLVKHAADEDSDAR